MVDAMIIPNSPKKKFLKKTQQLSKVKCVALGMDF